MASVYLIENIINGKMYIGKTDLSVSNRWKQHLNYSGNDRHLTHALRKYGKESFIVSEIAANLTSAQASEAEKLFIKEYNSISHGYNLTEGGEGSSGYRYTEEQRKKCSLAAAIRWGREEERRKQSERKKGTPAWNKGLKRTNAERLKQSLNSAQRKRTHCPQNHPLSGENLYISPAGSRSCKQCRRDAYKRHYRSKKSNKLWQMNAIQIM